MRLITEFHNFEIINQLTKDFEVVFDYVKIKGKTILASSKIDKGGNPIVRIDSKDPIKALMLIIDDNSIEIKSIVNTKGERGLFTQIMNILSKHLEPGSLIKVDQDVSGGFWDFQMKKYPEFIWEIK